MRWIKILIAAAAAIICFSAPAFADLTSGTELLAEKLRAAKPTQGKQDGWDNPSIYKEIQTRTITIQAEKNTALHDNFKWQWNTYTFTIWQKEYMPGKFLDIASMQVRRYSEFGDAAGKGFEIYVIDDFHADGAPDKYTKSYEITVKRDAEDPDMYYFLAPRYPEGFVNFEWYKFTRDQATEIQKEIVNYFLNLLKEN